MYNHFLIGGRKMADNKMKNTKHNKKEDGAFHSKQIKHDPQAESARAVFGHQGDNYQSSKK
jgi:hypothetical protein